MKKSLWFIILSMIILCGIAWGQTEEEWVKKAYDAEKVGNYDEAITCLKKAIAINPSNVVIRRDLGIAYGNKGMLDKAIVAFKEAIKIDPDYAYAYTDLGVTYGQMGMYDEAISVLKKAIALDPDYAYSHYNLGIAYATINKTDEAITELKKAIALDPNHARSHYNLGICYGTTGKYPLAGEHLYKAGLLFLRQNERESAIEAYEHLKHTKSNKLEQDLFKKLYPELKQQVSNDQSLPSKENKREWTVLTTLEDGGTWLVDKKNIEYRPNGFFRIWRKMIHAPTSPSKVSEMTTLHEVDCANEKIRMIHVNYIDRNGKEESVDTPFISPPYDWEELGLADVLLLLPLCK